MSSKRDIFKPRFEARPFEYPEAIELLNMLADTYWRHTELSFNADVNDIDNLPPHEKEIVLRSLLAISTIEVAVKSFWGQLGSHFPTCFNVSLICVMKVFMFSSSFSPRWFLVLFLMRSF